MQIIEVLETYKIGENTAVTINDNGANLKNGVGILDENGNPYEVLSIGMFRTHPDHIREKLNRITLLVKGNFSASKIYV